MKTLREYAFLVVDTGEGIRTSEESDFDSEAYEEDRQRFINEGMRSVVASQVSVRGFARKPFSKA
jgi:hypothetical protein